MSNYPDLMLKHIDELIVQLLDRLQTDPNNDIIPGKILSLLALRDRILARG